ncbi:hypothetical protein FZEAL_6186 [Fusarium zealandicum]|uniref:Uncharacterized protein n=1 Tax=Fusarium zealandicum TaxID=1053134 RepID=A0A8H4UIB8_9HYPO|nr:hypothetical protein FZEAL_6186 [Fusarium zealandicum]
MAFGKKKRNKVFEKEVYLALKDIFQGEKALLRTKEEAIVVIEANIDQEAVKTLLQNHSIKQVARVVKLLLVNLIFFSEEKAMFRFQEEQSAQADPPQMPSLSEPLVSNPLAQETGAMPFLFPVTSEDTSMVGVTPCETQARVEGAELASSPTPPARKQSSKETQPTIPPPAGFDQSHTPTELLVSLPLRTQRLVLSRVQAILEYALFHFAKVNMPELLANRNWHCPTHGELNLWVLQLSKRKIEFEARALFKIEATTMDEIFVSATRIRHIAVHRTNVHTDQLRKLLGDAEILCTLVASPETLGKLQEIRSCIEGQITDLQSRKGELHLDLQSSLAEIAIQHEQLDALERATIKEAHDKLDDHHLSACDALDKVLLDRDMILFAAGKEPSPKTETAETGWLALFCRKLCFLMSYIKSSFRSAQSQLIKLYCIVQKINWYLTVLVGVAALVCFVVFLYYFFSGIFNIVHTRFDMPHHWVE